MPQRGCDTVLVLRSQAGDTTALGELVSRLEPTLKHHASRLSRDPDDVLQDTWIAILRGISQLRDPRSLTGWALRILRRKSLDRGRREKRARALRCRARATGQARTTAEPAAEGCDAADELEALERAIQRLTPANRQILALRYFKELDLSRIAELMNIPKGTVSSRLHLARKTLRRALVSADRPERGCYHPGNPPAVGEPARERRRA